MLVISLACFLEDLCVAGSWEKGGVVGGGGVVVGGVVGVGTERVCSVGGVDEGIMP